MQNFKWLTEGIFLIHDGDSYSIVPYKGFSEKVKLIKEYRNVDYTLYKDEGSGVLSDYISCLLHIVAYMIVVILILFSFYFN